MPHASIADSELCDRASQALLLNRKPQHQLDRTGVSSVKKVLLSSQRRERDRGGTGGSNQVTLRVTGDTGSSKEVLRVAIRLGRLQTPGRKTTNPGQSARRGAAEHSSKPCLVRHAL